MLVALTFVIVGMIFVVYLMIIGEREKNRLRAKLDSFSKVETTQECPHSFGYLSGFPQDEPIPEECFGCPKAIECRNSHEGTEDTTKIAEPQTQ